MVGQPQDGDEPEAAVLFIACLIGLATGAGVVLFNETIILIRKFAFLQVPVDDISWATWARQLNFKANIIVTFLPPTVGGITVGLYRYLVGKSSRWISYRKSIQKQPLPHSSSKILVKLFLLHRGSKRRQICSVQISTHKFLPHMFTTFCTCVSCKLSSGRYLYSIGRKRWNADAREQMLSWYTEH